MQLSSEESPVASTAFSQMLPSGTERLDKIISQIQEDATNVEKLAVIVEARLEKGEREDAYKEREAAGIERKEQKKEREEQSKFRDEERLFREGMFPGDMTSCMVLISNRAKVWADPSVSWRKV